MHLLTALEARFVPFQSTGNPLLCSVNGFATFRALWVFHGLERHFYTATKTQDHCRDLCHDHIDLLSRFRALLIRGISFIINFILLSITIS